MTAPIRVALVGLSARAGWAMRSHLPALRGLDAFSVTGVLASTPERSRAAAAAHGIPRAYESIHQLASADDIDLAVVAVRVPDHAALVAPILASGTPVYCEWPLGASLTETEELAWSAAQAGVAGFVGLQGRLTPAVRHLRSLLDYGIIGALHSSSMRVRSASWGSHSNLRSSYLRDAASGAGLLSIPGGHALDILTSCLGRLAKVRASCVVRRQRVALREGGWIFADSPDHWTITGALGGGQAISIELDGDEGEGPDFQWELVGERGTLQVTCDRGLPQHGRLRIRGLHGTRVTDFPLPSRYDLAPHLADSHGHAVAHTYLAVRSDLQTGTALAPSFRDAVRRHRLLDAIERSARLAREVHLHE